VIVRTVLAVVLATALLGVTLPALDDARRERASVTVTDQVDAIERTATRLHQTDDPTVGAGARRIVTMSLPASDWTTAGVDRFAIRPGSGDSSGTAVWHVDGGTTHTRALDAPRIGTGDGQPLVLDTAGHHRLVLALDDRSGTAVVTVRRLK